MFERTENNLALLRRVRAACVAMSQLYTAAMSRYVNPVELWFCRREWELASAAWNEAQAVDAGRTVLFPPASSFTPGPDLLNAPTSTQPGQFPEGAAVKSVGRNPDAAFVAATGRGLQSGQAYQSAIFGAFSSDAGKADADQARRVLSMMKGGVA